MKKFLISLLKALRLYEIPAVPNHISKNFKSLTAADEQKLLESKAIGHYMQGQIKENENLNKHINDRLENFRTRHIVFLDAMVGLTGKKIIEIGCGLGTSSVALAEQGAKIWGIDVDQPGLDAASEFVKLYGLENEIVLENCNATELDKVYEPGSFDVVIFFASAEHMTYTERLQALKAAWKILKKDGTFCILGTPNRLWFFDEHTSLLPFYLWLPDDLAFQYSAFSSRKDFNQLHNSEYSDAMKLIFSRWGRGVSYHEIDLAIKPANQLKVLGDLHSFERPDTFLQKWAYSRTDEYQFKKLLAKIGPANLAPGFYEYYLDVVILKQ